MKIPGKVVFLIALALVLQSGCGGGDADVSGITSKANETHLQKVANAYKLYQLRNNKAVEDADQLKNFIATATDIDKNLEFMNIDRDSFPDYFVSERDGEEFLIRWKVWINDRAAPQPLVFEKTGVDGKRQVFWVPSQEVEECDKTRYDNLLKGKFERKDMDKEYIGGQGTGTGE